MSDAKCPPPASRTTPIAAPNRITAPVASGCQGGGKTAAADIIHIAPDGSPATNEQFFGQSPRGSHHGMKCSSPLNAVTSIGRGRPQLSLRITLVTRPG